MQQRLLSAHSESRIVLTQSDHGQGNAMGSSFDERVLRLLVRNQCISALALRVRQTSP